MALIATFYRPISTKYVAVYERNVAQASLLLQNLELLLHFIHMKCSIVPTFFMATARFFVAFYTVKASSEKKFVAKVSLLLHVHRLL